MGNDENFEDNIENYIKEKNIHGQPKALSNRELEIIRKQMENVFVIELNDGYGTGFFCKIRFPDEYHLLPVLITNNHVINDMNTNFAINHKNYIYVIEMNGVKRRYYTEKKKYDITIIEILKMIK